MAVFYTVKFEDAMDHSIAFATLREAREAAKGLDPKAPHDDGWITKHVVVNLPIRQLMAALYNRKGYCEKSVEIGK